MSLSSGSGPFALGPARRRCAACYLRGVSPHRALLITLLGCRGQRPLADALRPDPAAAFQVYAFTAEDPAGPWTRAPTALAHGLSSLGLHRVPEGEPGAGGLALTGLVMDHIPGWWEERFPRPTVWGLRTRGPVRRAEATDPEQWAATSWALEDDLAGGALDPQGFEGRFYTYAAQGRSGDPAQRSGEHSLRVSPPPEALWTAPGLADPSPVRFQGLRLLFATRWPDGVVQGEGEPLQQVAFFPGVTVPFATVVPGEPATLWLLAQAPVAGRRQPVVATSEDARHFSPWSPLLDLGDLASCTSPVMGPVSDGWVLFCVEERGAPAAVPR